MGGGDRAGGAAPLGCRPAPSAGRGGARCLVVARTVPTCLEARPCVLVGALGLTGRAVGPPVTRARWCRRRCGRRRARRAPSTATACPHRHGLGALVRCRSVGRRPAGPRLHKRTAGSPAALFFTAAAAVNAPATAPARGRAAAAGARRTAACATAAAAPWTLQPSRPPFFLHGARSMSICFDRARGPSTAGLDRSGGGGPPPSGPTGTWSTLGFG